MKDCSYDIISGVVGCIGGLLVLHVVCFDLVVREMVVVCGRYLFEYVDSFDFGIIWCFVVSGCVVLGFSYGLLGIVWVFIELWVVIGDVCFLDHVFVVVWFEWGFF